MPDIFLDITQIKTLLGYAPVYMMVDKIHIQENESYTGTKYVSANEPYFIGHFPNNPVLPGVLQVEAMFQTAVVAIKHQNKGTNQFPLLAGTKRVKFRKPVVPGDQLDINISISDPSNEVIIVNCSIKMEGEITSEAQLEIKFINYSFPPEELPEVNKQLSLIQAKSNFNELNLIDIQKIIPHRYPFIFIDKVFIENDQMDKIKSVSGLKNVTANETLTLSCHKQNLFMTNTILIEIIAQAGCVGMLHSPENKDKIIYFMSIDNASFFTPVTPANRLVVHAELKSIKEKFGKCVGKIFISNTLVAEAQFKFAIMNPE